jgi:hypothetical protein
LLTTRDPTYGFLRKRAASGRDVTSQRRRPVSAWPGVSLPGAVVGPDLADVAIACIPEHAAVLPRAAQVVVASIRAAAVAARTPPQLRVGGRRVSVVLGEPLACLLEFDRHRGQLTLDAGAIAPMLESGSTEEIAVVEAVLNAAWARFDRLAVDNTPSVEPGEIPAADCGVEDLRRMFSAAFPFVEETRAFLVREVGLGSVAATDLSRVAGEAVADVMASDDEWRSSRAERLLGDRSDLRVLPVLAGAYDRTPSATARERIIRVYRAVGRAAYEGRSGRAVRAIRRATAGQRLAPIDDMIRDLLAVTLSGRVRTWLGVETSAFADALADEALIVDEGASDGTTSLDLAMSIREDCRLGAVPIRVLAADIENRFHIWRDAVFDADGRLVQVERDGVIWSRPDNDPGPWSSAVAGDLQHCFSAVAASERRAFEHAFMNPAAAAFMRRHPERLGLLTHDLFSPLLEHASLIRAFNVLYVRLHAEADAPSYFEPPEILEGLRSIGGNLRPGGVAVVGSIVDHRSEARWFVDYEIWQRIDSHRTSRLLLRARHGRGVGVGAWRIELAG